jgi:glycogen(starch) synthase
MAQKASTDTLASPGPMRVLLVSWEYPPVIEGGLGRHVRKLAEQLVANSIEVHVLTRGGGGLPGQELRRGVHVHRVTAPQFPTDMDKFLRWVSEMNRDMRALGSELSAQLRFDLVHSHDWLVCRAAEQIRTEHGLPWLVTIHATEHGRHQGWVKQRPQSVIHRSERRMARSADHVITCSHFMAGHVAEVFDVGAETITVIPNGIDAGELLLAPAAELEALRARFARPQERLVLMVGRLAYEKGFHLALDALAEIAAKQGGVRFVLAGAGGAETDLRAQTRKLGLSGLGAFIGWAGDDLLHSLYRVADVCIVPSIYEPFGLVALEAMASGCVCVVADTGGLREVMPGDGSAGLRFASDDAGALREALEQLLGDDRARERMARQARTHALSFAWDEVALRTTAVYDELRSQREARSSMPS